MNEDLLLLADSGGEAKANDPPPTDMFYTRAALQRNNALEALNLGIAMGIAWVVFFLLLAPIALMAGTPESLTVIKALYPGFSSTFGGFLLAAALSFVYGLLSGLFLGIAYNNLIQRSILANESYETYG